MLNLSGLVFAQVDAQITVEETKPVTVKVTLKDYGQEPLVGVKVGLKALDERSCEITPITNPNASGLAPGISDQNGSAYFRLSPTKPGTITVIARAERIPEKPPWVVRLLRRIWYTFIQTERVKVENLELFGNVEYKIEFK